MLYSLCYHEKMVTKNQHIQIVSDRIVSDQAGFWSVFFLRPKDFTYDAGDWIDIHFEGRTLAGGVTYSLSSSPTEDMLRITFKEGVSEFKRALQAITSDDPMYISQYGNDYSFQLKKNQSSVLIAGGVGIAPFRSMLKEMYDNGDKNDVTLLYLNGNDDFLFASELDEWKAAMPNMRIHYIVTKGINRKKREKQILLLIKNTNHTFYISGPPGMVESTEHLLVDNGVQIRNIRIDSFGGY